jgi:hypothetical protein
MLMKFVKMLCLVVLVAMSAAAVHAGSISDPKLVINCVKPCTSVASNFSSNALLPCPPGANCFTDAVTSPHHPLMINYTLIDSGSETFFFQGGNPIVSPANGMPSMYIEIFGIPPGDQFGPLFNCTSDVFASTGLGVCAGSGTVATGSDFIFRLYDGTLTPGESLSATLTSTPEPSTMLMFLSLGPALGFAKKRWNARQSA